MIATEVRDATCPHCGKVMTYMSYNFRPPRKSDNTKWETVRYLVAHGFIYNHIYEPIPDNPNGATRTAIYPETLREAKEFVEKHKKIGERYLEYQRQL
ncbi:hypothetical protein [Mucilaginibacter lappiensis]|nr:hypothetical protein [Mucilaginibacter lappiensis]